MSHDVALVAPWMFLQACRSREPAEVESDALESWLRGLTVRKSCVAVQPLAYTFNCRWPRK